MIVIVLAAATAAVPVAPARAVQAVRVVSADRTPVSLELVGPAETQIASVAEPTAAPTPNLYQVPARCRNIPYHVVDRQGRPVARRLADLPASGGLQLLVDRRIEGCRVITLKYGTVEPDQPNPPSEQYQIKPLNPPPEGR